MSKNKKTNPYLEAYNKADKNLTQIMSEIKMLTTNPRDKMSKDTYDFKVDQLTQKWAKIAGFSRGDVPYRDLNFIVQNYERQKEHAAGVLGSRYQLATYGRWMDGIFKGSSGLPGLTIRPHYSKEKKSGYIPNEFYIDKFNPEGETVFEQKKEAAATDQYGRDYDNPNFGINPNRLNLSIQDGE